MTVKTKKKPKKTRSAIGNNPLDALLSPSKAKSPGANRAAVMPKAGPGKDGDEKVPKIRTTFHLPADLVDRLRNAVYWTPGLTLAELAETALRDAVATLEKKRGEPFPRREKELVGGRPIGS